MLHVSQICLCPSLDDLQPVGALFMFALTDPSSVEALVGQTVVLPCRVSPPPSSTVKVDWRRDGDPLSTRRHHQKPNGSLLVGPLSQLDSGWFLCVATREQERDHRYIYLSVSERLRRTSDPVFDRVFEAGLGENVPLTDFNPDLYLQYRPLGLLSAGDAFRTDGPALLHHRPPSALKAVSIQWTKDGQTLSDPRLTQHLRRLSEHRLSAAADSALYTCTASSEQQLEQRTLQLKVQADLKITTAPNNIQVPEGSTALLPCVVSGDNVNIGWSRNGVPVRPDGRLVLKSSDGSLILNSVTPADEGTYTCNAYTGIYSVSATAEVKLLLRQLHPPLSEEEEGGEALVEKH
ncbi:hypothetical protein F7725_008513 [Dissostichus mawsoni]|uniref:Ig-like domain-containing protein n=1 Tax=Dissostichus mawsoni TaxID=36200 RepID=A0A7J5Y7M0_DISMA|nr:hypothetical protein F7725_008513 [Dissostichus mawsoni]